MDNEKNFRITINLNLNDLGKAIYQNDNVDFDKKDFDGFTKEHIKTLKDIIKRDDTDEYMINDIINLLKNIDVTDRRSNHYKMNVEKSLQFSKELTNLLDVYTDKEWNEEPLDSDEVDVLVEHLRNQLNLINGNITSREYEKLENF